MTRNGRIILLWHCEVFGSKKTKFVNELEASGFLTGLSGFKSPFKKLSILGNIIQRYKRNEIINNFLLARDKLMSEIQLK